MFVLGTAGHIDHGKSALVHALTGIDPDRLREEKERGMTLDLGFAWLKLPSGREVGIVDVPGHERFIHNMLAGVGGIDLALLVVAANESVMPQTHEHLAIIGLLEIKKGLVAITKKDLVDEEWLSLVRMEVEELLKPTTLAGAPIVAVSATTREGLDQLVATIDRLLETTQPRKDIGRPRLPIDRIFTIAGSGTIVTGTLIDGSLRVGQNIEIVPSGLKSRIRGLQTHKAHIDRASPGSRVAANLVGITTEQISRGDVLTTPDWLVPTMMVTAKLRLLPHLRRPLRHNTTVSFYTGAAETMAKVRLLEGNELKPGETSWAQFILQGPVALVSGDQYIIRSTVVTLGGGKIVESPAKRLRRCRVEIIESLRAREEGTAYESIIALLETKQPIELAALIAKTNQPESQVLPVIESLIQDGRMVKIGKELILTAAGWRNLATKAKGLVEEYHRKFPTRTGMPRVELSKKLAGAHSHDILQRLIDDEALVGGGLAVRLPSHSIKLTPAQQASIDTFLKALSQNPCSPPTDLIPEPDLLNLLIEQQKVVKVSENVVFLASVYGEMIEKITSHIKEKGKITLAEVRDVFGTSRKYAQAILEHLDEKKVTRRVGDERVLWGG